jgi:hypothetical protein
MIADRVHRGRKAIVPAEIGPRKVIGPKRAADATTAACAVRTVRHLRR